MYIKRNFTHPSINALFNFFKIILMRILRKAFPFCSCFIIHFSVIFLLIIGSLQGHIDFVYCSRRMILSSGIDFTNPSYYSQGIQGREFESCKSNTISRKTTQNTCRQDTVYFSSSLQELLTGPYSPSSIWPLFS